MKIEVMCSDPVHKANRHLQRWAEQIAGSHSVKLLHSSVDLSGGDFLFLVSATEIVGGEHLRKFRYALVVHESAVPEGRGWSPLAWQVLEGKADIPITMFQAEEKVDSGAIWDQRVLHLKGDELYDEIVEKAMAIKTEMMDFAILNHDRISPRPQPSLKPSYYRRRTPEDSRIDPHATIEQQFELLRICDPDRFPAFFDLRGCRFQIVLRKMRS